MRLKISRRCAVKHAGATLFGLGLLCAAALAQVPDPTRPPGALSAPSGGVGALGMDVGGQTESGVQAVLVRPKGTGKSSALINGQYVEVGGMVGDKRVLKITEQEVVLKGAAGREVMKVIPAVEKTTKMPVKKMPTNKAKKADAKTKTRTENKEQ